MKAVGFSASTATTGMLLPPGLTLYIINILIYNISINLKKGEIHDIDHELRAKRIFPKLASPINYKYAH